MGTKKVSVGAGRKRTLANGITMELPEGLEFAGAPAAPRRERPTARRVRQAAMRIRSAVEERSRVIRALRERNMKIPLILEKDFTDYFETVPDSMVDIPPMRGIGATSLRPIRMHFEIPLRDAHESENYFALLTDGSTFYVPGSTADLTITKSGASLDFNLYNGFSASLGGVSKAGVRSIIRPLKLMLFKILKVPSPELGLAEVHLKNGTIESWEEPGPILAGEKAALFVHGFASCSDNVLSNKPFASLLEKTYDRVFVFDHETVITPVKSNAEDMLQKLVPVLLHESPKLDLIAHSRGGLVSRTAVEQLGAGGHFNRLIMFATPNRGSPIVTAVDASLKIATLMLNGLLGKFMPGPFIYLVKKALPAGISLQGMDDMSPDGPFVNALNTPTTSGLPYYCMSANYNVEGTLWKTIFARLADAAIDILMGQENDGVVPVQSAFGVDLGKYKPLTTYKARVSHSAYFTDSPSLIVAQGWMK
jgi:pimeloyl-ACP methyl ester carboxylesterase